MLLFRERLRQLRTEKGWSQDHLAKKIGISNSVVGRYELGDTYPSTENLIKIARIFSVSLDFLVGISDNRGHIDENEIKQDPDLLRIVNHVRPTIEGVPVTDKQWKLINAVLEGIILAEKSHER
jgi:transcriptional regulator with XRE-family HTH domain